MRTSGILCSGGSLNNVISGFISSALISSALELGLQEKHVSQLRSLYCQRMDSIKSIFDSKLPKSFECRIPGGGYFIWISGPSCFDSNAFSTFCKDHFAVQVLPGSASCPCDPSDPTANICSNSFRLSIAYYEEDFLITAAHRLCEAIEAFSHSASCWDEEVRSFRYQAEILR